MADCLDDLTTKDTAANGHTDQSDRATRHSRASRNPATVVPGLPVDGDEDVRHITARDRRR